MWPNLRTKETKNWTDESKRNSVTTIKTLIQSSKRCPKAVSEISKYIYIKDLQLHFRHHGWLFAPSYYVCQFLHAPTDAYFAATRQNESRDTDKFTEKYIEAAITAS